MTEQNWKGYDTDKQNGDPTARFQKNGHCYINASATRLSGLVDAAYASLFLDIRTHKVAVVSRTEEDKANNPNENFLAVNTPSKTSDARTVFARGFCRENNIVLPSEHYEAVPYKFNAVEPSRDAVLFGPVDIIVPEKNEETDEMRVMTAEEAGRMMGYAEAVEGDGG